METNYFALRYGKIVYVPDVPEKQDYEILGQTAEGDLVEYMDFYCQEAYNKALQSAIANGDEVENQKEVKEEIENSRYQGCTASVNLEENTLYPLQCRVDIIHTCIYEGYKQTDDYSTSRKVARVTFDEQPEKKPCANCKETIDPCACMRNICHVCGDPVGNITFTVCDKCWDLEHPEPESAGQEQEEKLHGMWEASERLRRQDQEEIERLKERIDSDWYVVELNKDVAKLNHRIAELEEALRELLKQSYDLREHCQDRNYIDFNDPDTDGAKLINDAIDKAIKSLQSPPGESDATSLTDWVRKKNRRTGESEKENNK